MQSGSGASIEAFGFGRYPSYAEHVVIIPVIDGSSLPLPDSEVWLDFLKIFFENSQKKISNLKF